LYFFYSVVAQERPCKLKSNSNKDFEAYLTHGSIRQYSEKFYLDKKNNFSEDCFNFLKDKIVHFFANPNAVVFKEGENGKYFRFEDQGRNSSVNIDDILNFTNQWDVEKFKINEVGLIDLSIIKIITICNY